jgi:hypothetical protein
MQLANTFYSNTNFPNCQGAIDGKNIGAEILKTQDHIILYIKNIFQLF